MSRIMGFIHDRVALAGHSVTEFTADDAPRYARRRYARFGFPWAVYRHCRAAARAGVGYDLINVHEPSAAAVLALRRRLGRPAIVVTSHGVEERSWQVSLDDHRLGRGGLALKTRLTYPPLTLSQCRYALRCADHVFCLNQQDRQFVTTRYGRRPDEVTRIYPAADPTFADPGREYNQPAHNILFAGTWRSHKGIHDLVPAFGRVAATHPDVGLTVLGPGVPMATVLDSFPADLRGRVRVVQANTEAETVAVYRAADVFVLPSLFEGTPLVIMEAMAAGLPLVTTATCGMLDVVADGQTGLLVPVRQAGDVAAALHRLLTDPGLRARLGRAAAVEAATKYTWDAAAAPVITAYETLVPAAGSR